MSATHEKMFTAGEAAQGAGVSRTTISRAAAAGRIEGAVRDEAGAWVLPLSGLLAAGFNPGKPSPPDPVAASVDRDKADELTRLRAQLDEARTQAHVLTVKLDAAVTLATERAERIVDLRQALRQLEQGESSQGRPESTQAAEPATPMPSHAPDPSGASTGEQSVWEFVKMKRDRWRARRRR